jgi:hypothetical protein
VLRELHDIGSVLPTHHSLLIDHLSYAIKVSKLIPIVVALMSVVGVSMMLIIPTTTIPVSGSGIGEQCRHFPVNTNNDGSGSFNPTEPYRFEERCCPEGQVWQWDHPGPSNGYWDCEPA